MSTDAATSAMAGDTNAKLTLSQAFAKAQSEFNRLMSSSMPTRDGQFQAIKETIDLLCECKDKIRRLGLFSINETAEEYGASDLKYMLVNTYLGQLILKKIGQPEGRGRVIEQAMICMVEFLSQCQDMDIMTNKQDKELFAKMVQEKGNVKEDAMTRRQRKIERHRRQVASKAALKELEPRLLAKEEATLSSTQDDDHDEELERQFVLKLLDLQIQVTIDELASCFDELEMIKMMERIRPTPASPGSRGGPGQKGPENDWRLDTKSSVGPRSEGPLLDKGGRPLRPFVLVSDRERVREGVFRPSWNLPTMSLDDYLEEEFRRGNVIMGGGDSKRDKRSSSDDDDDEGDNSDYDNDPEKQDEKTMKQRKWDEFTDDNPRGAGNRGGNIG
ncbi:Type 2A phosphatase-associated protein 42 [Spiromyces aspiralis]|uniref:Type 2A phosphatase-associated protein 42 n=1 Tax=Spiromyces aspiralis TaxID=68401 RepID=A0ACC1HCW8_9FUNG|nr:Type 2A phosphatase-associated protein 42 [Spiromyces aspiralis]